MHTLPRSLEPASGESLVSYLLRLGHRLSLPPLQLIRAAGWTDRVQATHIPGSLLLNLTGPEAQGFARLTRQTAEEVSALTLTQWRDRYPPIAWSSVPGPGPKRPDPWLFVGSPRYCPTCLAGDCTPAQQLHGGPWRKLWHLPFVFSCVEHQTYLEASCPRCGQPRAISGRLIERANDHTLHPAQCRWTIGTPTQKRKSRACGGRLDQRVATDPYRRPHPTPDILRFQQSLLARLEPLTPASDASEYFTDLRLATALIATTWPEGQHLLDTTLAGHVAAYVHSASGNSSTSNGLQHRLRDVPPRNPIACAGLLRAAHSLLEADDLSEHLSQLVHTPGERPTRTPWVRIYARHEKSCSRRFRDAAEPSTRTYRKIGGPQGLRAPLRDDYRAEHIPAYLEPDWYERFFAPIAGIAPKVLRRTAAVRLVQWAIGGPLDEAATYLGIAPDRVRFRPNTDFQRWERAGRNPAEFERVLRELSAELRAPHRPLIDYQRRREALRDWALPPDEWDALVSELPPIPGPIRPAVGDRKRQDASVFIWVQVTQGEHLFAPRAIEAEQPQDVQREWALRRNTTWYNLVRPDTFRHYADLRKLLAEYAQQLARDIDSGTGRSPTVNEQPDAHAQ